MKRPSCAHPSAARRACHLLVHALIVAAAIVGSAASAQAESCANSGVLGTPYQGFGAGTTGGAEQPIYRVTTLADSGPGSLREAVSRGHRCVVFDVAGTIELRKQIYVGGPFVTVDGFTAPAPGITVRDYGISIWGGHGARNVIVRGLRFRDAGQPACTGCWDGIQIKDGASRVVIDHVSSHRASDGAIDIAGSSDITVQWSIFSGTTNQSLIGESSRVSMHHNLFTSGQNRNPQVYWDSDLGTMPPSTALDFRNNLVWDFSGYGTIVRYNATANVINNYYFSSTRAEAGHAIVLDPHGHVYAHGNHSGNGADLDARRNVTRAFAAAAVTTSEACVAAYEVLGEAGARGTEFGLDTIDSTYLADIPATSLPGCPSRPVVNNTPSIPPAPAPAPLPTLPSTSTGARPAADLVANSLVLPATIYSGVQFPIKFGLTNRGTARATGSRVRIYLSSDARFSPDDVLLRDRFAEPLEPGRSQWHALSETASVTPGPYYLLLVVDAQGAVTEADERNNVTAADVTIARATPSTPTPDLTASGVSLASVVRRGAGFPVRFFVVNRGTGVAAASRLTIYLSPDPTLSAGDVVLRNRGVSVLAPGASEAHALTEVIPTNVKPGSYYLLLVLDALGGIKELDERNNVSAIPVAVR